MRPLLALAIGFAICAVATSCGKIGEAGTGARRVVKTQVGLAGVSAAASEDRLTVAGHIRGDDDIDGDARSQNDDVTSRSYGHAASDAVRSDVAALVKSYFVDAARKDGAKACALLSRRLAEKRDLAAEVPEYYLPEPGVPLTVHGKGCVQFMTRLFRQYHPRLSTDAASVIVVGMRVRAEHGLVLLAFRTTPERQIQVAYEGGVWKIDALLDSEIL